MPYRARELLSHVLTPEQVSDLLMKHRKGKAVRDIAKEFGVHRNTVSNIINRAKRTGRYEEPEPTEG